MTYTFNLPRDEWVFGWFIASVHAVQHVFYRLVPPLIPILVTDLGTPLWQLGLLVSIYMFAGGAFQAPMGELSDRIDRQMILVASIVAMSIGYLVFATAPTLGGGLPAVEVVGYQFTGAYLLMSLGMVIAGIGYSGIHPVGYPLISANVSPENKGRVLGMWGSASKVGDAIAPLIVGVFVLVIGWRSIVVSIALFGFVYAAGCLVVVRRRGYDVTPTGAADQSDGGGLALRSEPQRFLFPIAVMLMFFLCLLFAGNGLVTFAPYFVSDVYSYSFTIGEYQIGPESVGNFYFGALLISAAVSQLVSGALTDRFDHRAVIVSYLALTTASLLVLATVSLSPVTLLGAFVLLGGTIYGINPARDALISDISPDAYEGRTFGYVFTVALVGSSAFPAVIGYSADIFGIRWSFGILAVGTTLGLLTVALLFFPGSTSSDLTIWKFLAVVYFGLFFRFDPYIRHRFCEEHHPDDETRHRVRRVVEKEMNTERGDNEENPYSYVHACISERRSVHTLLSGTMRQEPTPKEVVSRVGSSYSLVRHEPS